MNAPFIPHSVYSKQVFMASIAIAIIASFAFTLFPQLDIYISSWFFDPEKAGTYLAFPLHHNIFWHGLRDLLFNIPIGFGSLFIILWGLKLFFPKIDMRIDPKISSFIILTLIIIILLIINMGLKETTGRFRPDQTDIFGQKEEFTALFDFTGTCVGNCSFVSGEVASATWFLLLTHLLPSNLRKKYYILGSVFLVTVIFVRLGFGRHFASDCLFAILITYWCMFISNFLWFIKMPVWIESKLNEQQITKFALYIWGNIGVRR